jgi:hypothetical protein
MLGEVREKLPYRRHVRAKHFIPIHWWLENPSDSSPGQIVNYSQSGVLLEIDERVKPRPGDVIKWAILDAAYFDLPRMGRLIWCRPMKMVTGWSHCGVEFIGLDRNISNRLAQSVQKEIEQLYQGMNFNVLTNYEFTRRRENTE